MCDSPAAGLDLVVAILTILGVRKFGPSDSLAGLLRRQGVEYFVLILLVHTAIVVGISSLVFWGSFFTIFQALVFYDTRCMRRSLLTQERLSEMDV